MILTRSRSNAAAGSGRPARSPRALFGLFLVVAALTALELSAINLHDVSRPVRVTVLAGLAILKAGVILWSFMHLGREPRSLRLTVLTPIVLLAALSVLLMLDGVNRLGANP